MHNNMAPCIITGIVAQLDEIDRLVTDVQVEDRPTEERLLFLVKLYSLLSSFPANRIDTIRDSIEKFVTECSTPVPANRENIYI